MDADLLTTEIVTHEDKGGIRTVRKDYSAFYDLERLRQVIDAYYTEDIQTPAV